MASDRKTRVVPVAGLKAPVKKGQKVAELAVIVPGRPETRLPLVAAADVAEAGPLLRAWNWLKSLVGM
jgi:D-alanyl-D-alanine carboxypeptidase (penicillin-binding protein 5/6)